LNCFAPEALAADTRNLDRFHVSRRTHFGARSGP